MFCHATTDWAPKAMDTFTHRPGGVFCLRGVGTQRFIRSVPSSPFSVARMSQRKEEHATVFHFAETRSRASRSLLILVEFRQPFLLARCFGGASFAKSPVSTNQRLRPGSSITGIANDRSRGTIGGQLRLPEARSNNSIWLRIGGVSRVNCSKPRTSNSTPARCALTPEGRARCSW